jgi:N-acetylmuramoyl-L-alanine amidase
VIDAGHGGDESGAIYGGIEEKDLNLDIANRLYNLLKNKNINVYMTRTTDKDVGLYDRANMANDLNASLFLSIHNNAYYSDQKGTETLYFPAGSSISGVTGKDFAQTIQNKLVGALKTVNRGIVERPGLAVLNKTTMPAALAEIAFMTNSDDMANLKSDTFKQKAAEALCDAVITTLNQMN